MSNKRAAAIALVAAIYTAVSLLLAPLSYSGIQVRIAEALTLLPLIYKDGIWGVTLGCFLTNLIGTMTGADPIGVLDTIVGTAATLTACLLTWRFRNVRWKHLPLLSMAMPVVLNGILVGLELGFVLVPDSPWAASWIMGLEVAAGELVSVILGWFLIQALAKTNLFKE